MFCCKCGKRIADDAVFCSYCGFKLSNVKFYDDPEPAVTPAQPEPAEREPQPVEGILFSMTIQNTFEIDKGVVITGKVDSGELKTDESVRVRSADGEITPQYGDECFNVSGISVSSGLTDSVGAGEDAGILIQGIPDASSLIGKRLVTIGTVPAHEATRQEYAAIFAGVVQNHVNNQVADAPVQPQYPAQPAVQPSPAQQIQNNLGINPVVSDPVNNAPVIHDPYGGNRPAYVDNRKLEITCGLKTGNTVLAMMNTGKLRVSQAGVEYSLYVGSQNHNHHYTLSEVASTQFKMIGIGLQPMFGYVVTLKSGKQYAYTYSPVFKSKMNEIDALIKSGM